MSGNSRDAPAAPIVISWNLTRLCNLACGHCYLDAVQRKREAADELSSKQALQTVRQIAEMAPGSMPILTGGEPRWRLRNVRDGATKKGGHL